MKKYEKYICTSETCSDNGGVCKLKIPIGYESPTDCTTPKSFKDGDEPDCRWVRYG